MRLRIVLPKVNPEAITVPTRCAFADEYSLHHNGNDTMLPRWLAEGFWYLSTFVRDHTSHPAWEHTIAREPGYFAHAYARLDALASWFFSGEYPWIDEEEGWAYKNV